MHTIWVIESNAAERSVALDLMGDFAVRRIASVASLLRLRGLNKELQPDMIIVTDTGEDYRRLSRIQLEFTRSEIYLMDNLALPKDSDPGFRKIPSPFCPIAFVRMFRKNQSQKDAAVQSPTHSYRDLILDVVSLKITAKNSGEAIALTRKEALVLKKFFERPGACIGREVLLKDVWDGVRVTDRSIDAQICRLRKIVGDFGLTITSVYGQGYILG